MYSNIKNNELQKGKTVTLKVYSRKEIDTVVMVNGNYYVARLPHDFPEGDKILAITESIAPACFRVNGIRFYNISDKTIQDFIAGSSLEESISVSLVKSLIANDVPVSVNLLKRIAAFLNGKKITDEEAERLAKILSAPINYRLLELADPEFMLADPYSFIKGEKIPEDLIIQGGDYNPEEFANLAASRFLTYAGIIENYGGNKNFQLFGKLLKIYAKAGIFPYVFYSENEGIKYPVRAVFTLLNEPVYLLNIEIADVSVFTGSLNIDAASLKPFSGRKPSQSFGVKFAGYENNGNVISGPVKMDMSV